MAVAAANAIAPMVKVPKRKARDFAVQAEVQFHVNVTVSSRHIPFMIMVVAAALSEPHAQQ